MGFIKSASGKLLLALLLSLPAPPVSAQQAPPPPDPQTQTIRIGAEEVLLDVVVRDKKGRPVRDLKPEELQVYEDGVRQSLTSFRLREFASGALDPTAKPGPLNLASPTPKSFEIDATQSLSLVSLVFDNLDAGSRKLARDAALDFINHGMRANVVVAVFSVGQGFSVLQPFTANPEKVRQAVESATGRVDRQHPNISKQMVEQMEIIANATDFGPPAGTPGQAQAASVTNSQAAFSLSSAGMASTGLGRGGNGVDKKLAEITLNAVHTIEAAMNDQRARASIQTFLHLARAQRPMMGRKTILYFSSGLVVPGHLADLMRTTISEANRANVSIYAFDARGLGTESDSERGRAEMALAIKASRDSVGSSGSLDRSALQAGEFAENSVRLSKQAPLAELATGTGGFLVADTNDLRTPARRVASELSSYYVVAYAPTAREADGRFHNITVKVARADAKAQTRSGYFALPVMDGKPVMAYETPMLVALNAAQGASDFSHRAAALRFAPLGAQSQHVLMIEAPLANITFKADAARKQYSAHFAVLALIKDEQGTVVQRVSQDYPLLGKLERMESLKRGNLNFTDSFTLAPGSYTLETVVHDLEARRSSVKRQKLIVPTPSAALSLSSLTLVKRLEPAGAVKTAEEKPLVLPQGRIVPLLDETIDVETAKYLSLFLKAYAPPDAQAAPALTLDFLRNGQVVSRHPLALPKADERGRIDFVVSFPAASFPSGQYQVRALLTSGAAQVEEQRSFTIVNPKFVVPAAPDLATAEATGLTAAPFAFPPPLPTTTALGDLVTAASRSVAGKANEETRAAAIDIESLLREVETNATALSGNLLAYTYSLRKLLHVLDAAGRPTKEEFQDYEAYAVRGRHVLVMTAANGKPLAQWQVDDERRRATESLERAAREEADAATTTRYFTAALTGSYRGRSAGLVIDPAAFLRIGEFSDPRYEMLDGREMIALDFVPRRGVTLPLERRFAQNLTGTVWIDAADRVLARIEARNLKPGLDAKGKTLPVNPASKLIYQQAKLANGDWVPSVIRLNAAGDGSAFFGLNWDAVFEFKEYKQFDAKSGEEKILAPADKP